MGRAVEGLSRFLQDLGAKRDLRRDLGAAARSGRADVLRGGNVDGKLTASCIISITARAGRSATTAICRICSCAEGARKAGLGRALIEAVYREARAAGASRVHWLTHETNATARALYDTLADRPGFIQYRKLF